jgi:lantibiotic modifying enzyme
MTERPFPLLKCLGWYEWSAFPPKNLMLEKVKVNLPMCLLKQHDMKDYGEVKCVLMNGHIYILNIIHVPCSLTYVHFYYQLLHGELYTLQHVLADYLGHHQGVVIHRQAA